MSVPFGKGRQLLSGRGFPWEEDFLLSATSIRAGGRIDSILPVSPDVAVPHRGEGRSEGWQLRSAARTGVEGWAIALTDGMARLSGQGTEESPVSLHTSQLPEVKLVFQGQGCS